MNIEHANPDGVFQAGVYTHTVTVENAKLLFVSGQVSNDADGNLVGEGDLRAQMTQVLTNLRTVLAAHDADFNNVLKLTMFIVNYQYEDRAIIVETMKQVVDPARPPANTLVGVQSLARPGLMVEIEAVAALPL